MNHPTSKTRHVPSTASAYTSLQLLQYQIRTRPVSYGNPTLETYHGNVYTIEPSPNDNIRMIHNTTCTAEPDDMTCYDWNHTTDQDWDAYLLFLQSPYRPLVEGNHEEDCHHEDTEKDDCNDDDNDDENGIMEVRNMAAMIHVPPNQVPDGILHVSRSHRPFIRHVRILMMETTIATQPTSTTTDTTNTIRTNQDKDEQERDEEKTSESDTTNTTLRLPPHHSTVVERPVTTDRTYLILFELEQEVYVVPFVQDLHGQPYTYLDDSIKCHVVPVLAVSRTIISPRTSSSQPQLPSLQRQSSPPPPMAPTTSTPPQASTLTSSTTSSEKYHKTTVDDYNCAVCLESMELRHRTSDDEPFHESQSILTTVCNHSFHMDCLEQWQDSPCPVCRYDHAGWNNDTTLLSQCHICSTTQHNYVCLICGIVSCGSSNSGGGNSNEASTTTTVSDVVSSSSTLTVLPPLQQPQPYPGATSSTTNDTSARSSSSNCQDTSENFEVAMIQQRQRYQIVPNSHAWKHYNDTLHAYAICTDTQHVWDFAGQGYVHRLLQNKEDGKLVEVSDPLNTTSQERSSSPGLTQAQEGEVVHRKLESFASQYYTLLKSQLEQQRTYYESQLDEIRRDYSKSAMTTTTTTHQKPKKRVDTAADLIVALKQERQQLTQRLQTVQEKCRKVNSDVTFLSNLNESLAANQVSLRQQIQEAQRERAETRQMIDESLPPLQEKVTMLMLQLESTSNSNNNIASNHTETITCTKKAAAKR